MSGPADSGTQRAVPPTPPAKSNRNNNNKEKVRLNQNTAARESTRSSRRSLSVKKGEREAGDERTVHSKATDRFDSLHTSAGRGPVSKRHHALRPPHLVSPQYEILDTQVLTKRQTTRGLPVSGHMGNKQCTVSTTIEALKPLSNCTDQKQTLQQKLNTQHESDLWLEPRNHISPVHKEKGIIPFYGSLRPDTVDLAPGVSLSESQGPLTASVAVQWENTAELRPMRRYPVLPMLTAVQRSTGAPAQAMPHNTRL